MADEKKIEVTNQNALKLIAGMTDILIQQNKTIILHLANIGMKLERPATDLGGSSGTINCDNK